MWMQSFRFCPSKQAGPFLLVNCVVPENIHTHPTEGHWKFLGGGRVLKAKFLEAMYDNIPECPGGRGVQNKKKPSLGGVWIFSGNAHF